LTRGRESSWRATLLGTTSTRRAVGGHKSSTVMLCTVGRSFYGGDSVTISPRSLVSANIPHWLHRRPLDRLKLKLSTRWLPVAPTVFMFAAASLPLYLAISFPPQDTLPTKTHKLTSCQLLFVNWSC